MRDCSYACHIDLDLLIGQIMGVSLRHELCALSK